MTVNDSEAAEFMTNKVMSMIDKIKNAFIVITLYCIQEHKVSLGRQSYL